MGLDVSSVKVRLLRTLRISFTRFAFLGAMPAVVFWTVGTEDGR